MKKDNLILAIKTVATTALVLGALVLVAITLHIIAELL